MKKALVLLTAVIAVLVLILVLVTLGMMSTDGMMRSGMGGWGLLWTFLLLVLFVVVAALLFQRTIRR